MIDRCIQETQLVDNSKVLLNQIWGNHHLEAEHVNARGRSGGLISLWNPSIFVKLGVTKGDNFLHVFGSVAGTDEIMNVVNVYAPHDSVLKSALWETLIGLIGNHNGLWIMMGDFNVVRDCSERLNSVFDHREARDFNDFIFRARLHEYRMGGLKYTYMSPDGMKCSKIDRMLVCDRFFHRWPCATFFAHPRIWSDHAPISLSTVCLDYGPPPFKFYNSWLKLDGIDNVVSSAVAECELSGRPDIILMSKFRHVKAKLKDWRKMATDNEFGLIEAIKEECHKYETLAEMGLISDQEHESWLEMRFLRN
ncbi:hypothetical protein E3N88_06005 [Mikania micrantha]|uniref:Endonuclease/exonuclease/phosphatase domain-containing protein n=1 Tax=Mikania micrantha TaxID=192012 RepID=A0A5N6PQG7_9ASTR|nr:hypothetical protein E3N88_06005 [Mikania micrantha]